MSKKEKIVEENNNNTEEKEQVKTKKRFFIDWSLKCKIIFIVSILIIIGCIIFCILYKKEEVNLDDNGVISGSLYKKIEAIESGDNYAKYEIELDDNAFYELENGNRIDFLYLPVERDNDRYMIKYNNKYNNKYNTYVYNDGFTLYTIGRYVVIDNKDNIYIIDNNGESVEVAKNGNLTKLTDEEGLNTVSLKVLDDGVYVNYSRYSLVSNEVHIYTDATNLTNVCKNPSFFMNDSSTYSFDYVYAYDKEEDELIEPSEKQNVVTIAEFRNSFDTSECNKKPIYYVYKYWFREGGVVYYQFSDTLPNDKFEELDRYVCETKDCVFTHYSESNGNDTYSKYYIYDGGKLVSYDFSKKDGFKSVKGSPTKIIDVDKYNLRIEEYHDGKAKLFVGYDSSKKEYVLSSMGYYDALLDFKYSSMSVGISRELGDNYITITPKVNSDGRGDTIVYDIKNEKEVASVDIVYGSLYKKDDYYMLSFGFTGPSFSYIYDKNFKLIEEDVYNYNFSVHDNKLYVVYGEKRESDGNLVNTKNYRIYDNGEVKTSSTFDSILSIDNKYALMYQDKRLKLIDADTEEVVADFADMDDVGYYHNMLSGEWEKDGKKGLYFIFNSKKANCSDIDKTTLTNFFSGNYDEALKQCKEYYEGDMSEGGTEGGLGVEYYYIYDTKEVGRFYTMIGGYAKPILYLYPENDNTKVTVKFKNPNVLTTTYPKYNNYWKVKANKNGDLVDNNGRSYYGLYWEESGSVKVDFSEGFYVTKDNAIDFLEDKLAILGLTEREANEFIMYWLPILEKNGKNLVYFELTDSRESYNGLDITPKPDSMLRIAIHIKKVDKKTSIREQYLPTFKREGFTVVEWGGVLH